MNIYLFEDNIIQRTQMRNIILSLCLEQKIVVNNLFESGKAKEILQQIHQPSVFNMYFLDMEIDGQAMAGLELAKEIRQKDALGVIVFITSHDYLAPKTFDYLVSALSFIDKNLSEAEKVNKIRVALIKGKELQLRVKNEADLFYFHDAFGAISLPFNEIYYVEKIANSHKVNVVAFHKQLQLRSSLHHIQEQEKRLYKIHQSYLVNPYHVAMVKKKERYVVMTNGEKLDIAKSRLKEFEAFMAKQYPSLLKRHNEIY